MMKNKSPLRYPGGKTRAVRILTEHIQRNYPERNIIISPFFGGGSLELSLSTSFQVIGNDLFSPLIIFWKMVKMDPVSLSQQIRVKMPVSKQDFFSYREQLQTITDPLEIATYYFIINRCSFSGSTFCGGYSAESARSRLTSSSLDRLEKVCMKNIELYNMDFAEFLKQHPETDKTILYADPPYYIKSYLYGRDGDLHHTFDHEKFAEVIKKRNDWILCYNDCEYIRSLYKECRIEKVEWSYGMNKTKKSSEILLFPNKN
jgi:DNA adenine methylase